MPYFVITSNKSNYSAGYMEGVPPLKSLYLHTIPILKFTSLVLIITFYWSFTAPLEGRLKYKTLSSVFMIIHTVCRI